MSEREVDRWRRYFRQRGFPLVDVLGSGMEGLTFTLGDERVAKVWRTRSKDDLRPLVAFYAELARQPLPFATPDIVELDEVDGRAVTVERELSGIPLSDALAGGAVDLQAAQECAVLVLEALATTHAGPAAEALPVFNEQVALWSAPGGTWGDVLTALLQRRLRRAGPQLGLVVTEFSTKVDRLGEKLRGLPPAPRQVVHGDLCLPNILIDEAGKVRAVLDWGFLSTRGDTAFDAGTFAGFFDMYGPEARQRDDELTELICRRLDLPRDLLLLYRALYALIGSNAYDPTGRDGHFRWCVTTLNRADVSAVLLG